MQSRRVGHVTSLARVRQASGTSRAHPVGVGGGGCAQASRVLAMVSRKMLDQQDLVAALVVDELVGHVPRDEHPEAAGPQARRAGATDGRDSPEHPSDAADACRSDRVRS